MNITPPIHRRVPRDAGGRSDGRPHGDAHPRASGRKPGSSPPWLPAARVVWRPGGDRMMLLRRRPREVYRVYSEEEYLSGAGLDNASIDEWPVAEWPLGEPPLGEPPVGESPLSVETTRHRAGGEHRRRQAVQERQLHRMAGVAMLAGAMGTVGGVVVLNGAGTQWPRRAGEACSRRRTPRGSCARPRSMTLNPRWARHGRWSRVLHDHPASRVVRCRHEPRGAGLTRRSNASPDSVTARSSSPARRSRGRRRLWDLLSAGAPEVSTTAGASAEVRLGATPKSKPSSDSSAERCARALRTRR